MKAVFVINNLQTYRLVSEFVRRHNYLNEEYLLISVNQRLEVEAQQVFFDCFSIACVKQTLDVLARIKECVTQSTFFYIPNVNNILCNYIFYTYPNICILVEGMLSYTGTAFSDINKNVALKTILSKIYGLKYSKYSGDITGIDSHKVKSIVAPSSIGLESVKTHVETVNIFPLQELTHEFERKVLIVGQRYHEDLPEKIYRNVVAGIRSELDRYSDYEIYYQPHPLSSSKDPIAELERVQKVDGSLSSEEIFFDNFSICISISSTVLFNIKLILGEKVICTSIGLDMIPEKQLAKPENLKKLFERVGIEVK